ncbi:MAG: lipopolysaccharide biosynthesis protein [Ideonella sp.]|nr:lipopolysaccharide biosynthesis protein [Ideonella sp.]
MKGLAKTGAKALKWSTLIAVARFSLQLLAQVILARMLGPEIYGVFGLGVLVLTLATFASNLGLGASLLYRDNVTERDIRFAYTWQMLAGVLASLVLWWAAPWLAAFFREPRAEDVVRWLGLSCVITSAGAVAATLAQRALKFRQVGMIQVGSYALGYLAVGVPMAWMGHTTSALIAAWLVQTTVSSLGLLRLHPHAWRPLLRYEGHWASATEGRNLVLSNVVNWVLGNIDKVLVGRLLPTQAMGLYNMGANLALMPSTMLLSSLQPTLTALYGQAKHAPERIQAAYLQSLAMVGVLTMPVFIVLSFTAEPLVLLVYGQRWAEAGGVLAVLFLTVPAYLAQGLSTPLLWTLGRGLREPLAQLPALVLGAIGVYAVAPLGVTAIAWAALGIMVLRMVGVTAATLRALQLPLKAVLPMLGRSVGLSVLTVAAILAGTWVAGPQGWPLWLQLPLPAVAAGALWWACWTWWPQCLGADARDGVQRLLRR